MQVNAHNFVETFYMPGEYPGFFIGYLASQIAKGVTKWEPPSQRAQNFPG